MNEINKAIISYCPECNSIKLRKYGTKFVKKDGVRIKIQQYQCRECGRVTVNPIIRGKNEN